MTVEYVLLIALFTMMLMAPMIKGPYDAFKNAGPKLGARIEKHLSTGDGFDPGLKWQTKKE